MPFPKFLEATLQPGDDMTLTLRIVSAAAGPGVAPDPTLSPAAAAFPRITINPGVQAVFNVLGAAIASQVDIVALEHLAVEQLVFHPTENPVPTILAHVDTLFKDEDVRRIVRKVLGYLVPAPQSSFTATPPEPEPLRI